MPARHSVRAVGITDALKSGGSTFLPRVCGKLMVVKIPIPQIGQFSCPPTLDVRTGVEPSGHPGEPGFRVVCHSAELDDDIDPVVREGSTAPASVRLDGFEKERVVKGVCPCFSVARDDELASILAELAAVLLPS